MGDIQRVEAPELDPEVIVREMVRVLEIAIPGITLTPRLGDPELLSTHFDAEEFGGKETARLMAGQQVRSLGMWVAFHGEPWRGGDMTSTDLSPQRWVAFATQLLSDIQDTISEATANPWPELRLEGRRTQAPCGARLEGRFLHMWFGARDEPVLKFDRVEVIKEANAG